MKEKAKLAVESLNQTSKRDQFLRSDIQPNGKGEYVVLMGLDDLKGPLMKLEMTVPNLQQARKLETAYRKQAEDLYRTIMRGLLDHAEGSDTENS